MLRSIGARYYTLQRWAKRRGCLLSYSQTEPGRELPQPSPRLVAEPSRCYFFWDIIPCKQVYLAFSLSLILLSRFFCPHIDNPACKQVLYARDDDAERELQCSCGQTRYLRIICTSIIVGLFLRNAPSSILVLCTNQGQL